MGKSLVIVESPAKAKTINKILGKDFVVKASMGHVRDLPPKRLGVDLENNFEPEYVASTGKAKVLTELRKEAKGVDTIYLAPDPDREGEAIAWHLHEALKQSAKKVEFKRVTYNQITPAAIKEAFAQPREIDYSKVNAQQARRIIDRIVGFQVSPLLWRRIRGGRSAGRVQTVALRLVVEREKEINKFVPEAFWIMGAKVCKQQDPKDPFEIALSRIDGSKAEVKSQEFADELAKDLETRKLTISDIQRKTVKRKPYPPFITSTLQQAASSTCSFSPKRTMGIAQRLYEGVDDSGGLITYMRTDSPHLAPEAIASIREYVTSACGENFLPAKPIHYKGKGGAQEAHEAVRPTDLALTPDMVASKLKPEELKLYTLIWQRTIACQMVPAEFAQLSVEIDAVAGDGSGDRSILFRASASNLTFDGYRRVMPVKEKDEPQSLPPLDIGEVVDCVEWLSERKETQPPKRYSEASLIKELEANGVGRPSTYAATISTLEDREYVISEKRSLRPTDAGMKVCDFLVDNLSELFDVQFTALMEEDLDKVEDGAVEWTGMLKSFYTRFSQWLIDAQGKAADTEYLKELLTYLDQVSDFEPSTRRGTKTYDDAKFLVTAKELIEGEEGAVSMGQLLGLQRMTVKYREQIANWNEGLVETLHLNEAWAAETAPVIPPRTETHTKLKALDGVKEWAEPVTRGKRTYDDKKFYKSLASQVEGEKRLSDRQVAALDRIVQKYAEQISNYAEMEKEFKWDEIPEDNESGPLILLAEQIKEFLPPTTRGKRTYDDADFVQSLTGQFKTKKSLSDRQRAALKRTLSKYATQIADYDKAMEAHGLPAPKVPKEPKAAEDEAPKKKAAKKKAAPKKKAASKKKAAPKKKAASKKKAAAKADDLA